MMTSGLKTKIAKLAFGQIGVAALQGLQLIIIARALGPHQYGTIAWITALTTALLPFSGFGTANLLLMRLARKEVYGPRALHPSLIVAVVSGVMISSIFLLFFTRIESTSTPTPIVTLALIFISELIFTKITDTCQHYHLGNDHQPIATKLLLVAAALRTAGALFVSMSPNPDAQEWAVAHCCAGLVGATYAIKSTRTPPPYLKDILQIRRAVSDIKQGIYFSLSFASRGIYTDIDKAILAKLSTADICGQYSAAFRLTFMATTPLTAALLAFQAKMYEEGKKGGAKATLRHSVKLSKIGFSYAACAGLLIFLAAPKIELVLGHGYSASASIAQYLSFFPLLIFGSYTLLEALTTSGHQVVRAKIQMAAAVASIFLNFPLIYFLSWKGAVIAAYLTHLAIVFAAAYILAIKTRLQK